MVDYELILRSAFFCKSIYWSVLYGAVHVAVSIPNQEKKTRDRSFHVAWPLTCFNIVKLKKTQNIPVYYRKKSNKLITAKSLCSYFFIHVQFTRSTQYRFSIFSMGTLFVTLDKDTI